MELPVFSTVAAFRAECDEHRARGARIGFVPTLGALTPAHARLIERARQDADRVYVSVFVNPTQFGPGEDFTRYPRDLAGDCQTAARAGAHGVFSPELSEFYPPGEATRVRVTALTEPLCGRTRPGHFEGVATVVAKLLIAAGPCVAVFGRKDFQQLRVVQRLVRDLCLPVRIVDHALVRDADGLASSSRNRYLSPADRALALGIPRALRLVVSRFEAGVRDAAALQASLVSALRQEGLEPEYAEVLSAKDFSPVQSPVGAGDLGAFVAVRVGTTRLIDNVILGEDPAPQVAAK